MTTVLEVAEYAEVSKTTISRVLPGNSYISQGTKDRVFQVIEESSYRPNLLTRNLSAKSTQMLGLVVASTLYHDIYFSELLFHAMRTAGEKGRQLLLADGKHNAEEERQAIQYLLDLRYDVIMIYPRFLSMDEVDDIIDAYSQPIIVLNRCLRKNSSHSVQCDHKQTSFSAVAELINAGHQEIIFLIDSMDSPTSIERLAGYKDALAQHGIVLNEKLIANSKWTPASGIRGVEMLFKCGAKFSALVVSNDDMAVSAMEALHERDVTASEQVSVIGFDDIAIVPYTVPALFSVKTPITEVIQGIIGRLIFILDDGDFPPPKAFSGKLIRRDPLTAPSR